LGHHAPEIRRRQAGAPLLRKLGLIPTALFSPNLCLAPVHHSFDCGTMLVTSVELDARQTSVNQWALDRPAPFPTDLLHNEQDRYDLVALFCRDMFIELMPLKQQSVPRPQAVMDAAQGIFQLFAGFILAVNAPYDDQTDHGNLAQQRQRWDGFISRRLYDGTNSGDKRSGRDAPKGSTDRRASRRRHLISESLGQMATTALECGWRRGFRIVVPGGPPPRLRAR
jgi:hypothetical protein